MSAFAAVALIANISKANAQSLIQKDLFFGRNIAGGGQVSEAQFQAFVDNVITPRFPAGLTIFEADGQFLDSDNQVIKEPAQVVSLFVEDTPESDRSIQEIVAAYLQHFNQESVLQVTNKDELKVGFGVGENLIDNDVITELIEAELFFGRNITGGGQVSEAQFQAFVDSFITPRFPAGLTIVDADGQFLDSNNQLISERSKQVTLILEDTEVNEKSIDEIIAAYLEQFQQESVLLVIDEDVTVAFDAGEPDRKVSESRSIFFLLSLSLLEDV
jgi:hypothetical protein